MWVTNSFLSIVGIVLITFTDLSTNTCCVGVARVGSPSQTIAVSALKDIGEWDMGGPLHSIVLIGDTHPLEENMLSLVSNALKS